jgi:hypothetical protein
MEIRGSTSPPARRKFPPVKTYEIIFIGDKPGRVMVMADRYRADAGGTWQFYRGDDLDEVVAEFPTSAVAGIVWLDTAKTAQKRQSAE